MEQKKLDKEVRAKFKITGDWLKEDAEQVIGNLVNGFTLEQKETIIKYNITLGI